MTPEEARTPGGVQDSELRRLEKLLADTHRAGRARVGRQRADCGGTTIEDDSGVIAHANIPREARAFVALWNAAPALLAEVRRLEPLAPRGLKVAEAAQLEAALGRAYMRAEELDRAYRAAARTVEREDADVAGVNGLRRAAEAATKQLREALDAALRGGGA